MKYLIIILLIITSCNVKNEVTERKCAITQIEETVGSPIDPRSSFKLITDCGNITTRDSKYRLGDTIIINVNTIQK
jgi:hypothetical protein